MDNLENLTNMFAEFLTIYKFVNKKKIADMLKSELENQQKVDIYQLSDGEHSTRDIASQVTPKCGHNTVARCWKQWALQGLVVPTERKGRFKAAFNLEEYGITEVKEEE